MLSINKKNSFWGLLICLSFVGAILVVGLAIGPLQSKSTSTQTNQSCSTLCWKNIHPGASRSADLLKVIAANDALGRVSIHNSNLRSLPDTVRMQWRYTIEGELDHAILQKDVVILIQVTDTELPSLGELVNEFGPPEFNLAHHYGSQVVGTKYVAYFPSKGLIAVIYLNYSKVFRLDPSMKINTMYYFQSTSVDRMFEFYPYLETYIDPQCTQKNWWDWKGYVNIEIPDIDCRK